MSRKTETHERRQSGTARPFQEILPIQPSKLSGPGRARLGRFLFLGLAGPKHGRAGPGRIPGRAGLDFDFRATLRGSCRMFQRLSDHVYIMSMVF